MGFWIFGNKNNDEIKKLKENLKNSFLNIKKDIDGVNKFLDHFKEKHNQHDQKHELHSQRLDNLEDEVSKLYQILREYDQGREERSSVHERSRAFKRSNQAFMNVQSLQNLKENLTPAQKRVIQMLNLTEIPLEYEDIAKDLKLSIVTVRRHLGDIKRMGFDVKEKMNVDTKRKVFYIEKEIKKAIRSK